MANGQTAAQTDEDSVSSILGGSDDSGSSPEAQGPVTPQTPAVAPRTASTPPSTPSSVQVDSSQKVHPHVAILAGLVNKIISGIQNAPGNPNNPLDRGFMNASPRNQQLQQAQVSKAQSEADMARIQTSMAQLQLLQTKHMVDRLPQADQDRYIQMSNDYYKFLTDKEGVEVSARSDDPKGAMAEADLRNRTDEKVKNGLGTYIPLFHRVGENEVKTSVVFIPKGVTQNDLDFGPNPNFDPDKPESDTNPKEFIIPAGTPQKGLPQIAKQMISLAQGDTKNQHNELARLNKLPEDNPNQIQAKSEQMQQWLDDKSNASTFKSHNTPDVQATIARLGKDLPAAEKRNIAEAKAKSINVTIPQAIAEAQGREAAKHDYDTVYARDDAGVLVATNRKTAVDKGYTQIDDTMSKADVSADRKTAPIIKDVRGKIQDYQLEIGKGDLSGPEAMEVRGIMALSDEKFEAKLEIFGFGAGVKPSTAQLQEMFRGYDINHLSDKAQNRLATYIAARSSALELQKAQTQSSRASKEGLTLDLAQIPNPGIDSRMANKQLKLLMDSINRISENNPFVPK